MKKFIFIFLFLFSFFVKATFFEEFQQIDLLLQQGKYVEALEKSKTLKENQDITEEEKESLENLINIIESKVKELNSSLYDVIFNNTGIVDINFVTKEGLESSSSGTVSGYGENPLSSTSFEEYAKVEKLVLESQDEEKINLLIKIYMKNNLFEKAMNLSRKSNNLESLLLGAKSARLIGKTDISIDLYKKVLNQDPNNLSAILGIGLNYRTKKEYKQAINYFKSYLEKGGTNTKVREVINQLNVLSNK